jgi:hypothetical protein
LSFCQKAVEEVEVEEAGVVLVVVVVLLLLLWLFLSEDGRRCRYCR